MNSTPNVAYHPIHPVRLVTAAALFDGHDVAINIMRRILQASGAEVIHLGHDRAAAEIVDCAIQEDVQGIAITSYQGGHLEFFRYVVDLIRERGASIKVFGGGGGTILPEEIAELHAYGVARIYTPDDGRALGLQGMVNDLLKQCDVPIWTGPWNGLLRDLSPSHPGALARLISIAENDPEGADRLQTELATRAKVHPTPVLGITGTGGAGKSSLVDELVRRYLTDQPDRTVAIISVDPSKRKTGGALLGDRIRMNAIHTPRVYMRSLATRQSHLALSRHVGEAIDICKAAGFDLIMLETSGIGQSDTEIVEHADVTLYVMTPEYGAATQLEKIDMLDFADVIAINKFDKPGALDSLRDVRKQVQRNRNLFDTEVEAMPVVGTVASQFNDPGTTALYALLMERLAASPERPFTLPTSIESETYGNRLIPGGRSRYLADIADAIGEAERFVDRECAIARSLWQLRGVIATLQEEVGSPTLDITEEADTVKVAATHRPAAPGLADLEARYAALERTLHPTSRALLAEWPAMRKRYRATKYQFTVRGRTLEQDLSTETMSHLRVPKVVLPRYEDWGDVLRWLLRENAPGYFPYTAGVYPLKREGEEPARMFAGEGGPERTNKRFHYLSSGNPAKRLSTAFDSVTLYGEDPDRRPDIYGKIGNSGVSIATLDDAKKLYSGFDLASPTTSVSMTINGPAPMLLAYFLNTAVDQACERQIRATGLTDAVEQHLQERFEQQNLPRPRYEGSLPEGHDGLGLLLLGTTGDAVLPPEVYHRIREETFHAVRGTVQADILKEDQAQNTCIFSTEFALRLMGDIQQYFIDHEVRNFYSVSISGYHIAEAGANPITQLAFTLANGFTYIEYYLSRGMAIDSFAPSLSFFFSNGLDPEYAVIGRVARRIWARALRDRYGANERSQKLKYHVQTSGRSLHAQEIAFNDIRTTLQALTAISDNCNSLHTNAYDEAITTPTEESVRRAMAIQLIINRELGLMMNENPLQGAFIIEELTDLVEAAVLQEFHRLSERGGVLGAMERMYQRSRIQEESLHYESLKHNGELPIIGVNTFLDPSGSPTIIPHEVIRSTPEEKDHAIGSLTAFQLRNADRRLASLDALRDAATSGGNMFEALMEASKSCTLGELSTTLYGVGGQYRRNM